MKLPMRLLLLAAALFHAAAGQDNGVLESLSAFPPEGQLDLQQGCVLGWHGYDATHCDNDDGTLIAEHSDVSNVNSCKALCYDAYDAVHGGECHAVYYYRDTNTFTKKCELHRYCKNPAVAPEDRDQNETHTRRCISSPERFAEQTPGGEVKRASCRDDLGDAWRFVQACDALYCEDAGVNGSNTNRLKYPTTATWERCRSCWDDFCTRSDGAEGLAVVSAYCKPEVGGHDRPQCKGARGIMLGNDDIVGWSKDIDDVANCECGTTLDPVCDSANQVSYINDCYAICDGVTDSDDGSCGHGGYNSGIVVPETQQFDDISARVDTNAASLSSIDGLTTTLASELNNLNDSSAGGGTAGGTGIQVKNGSGEWVPLDEASRRRRLGKYTEEELYEVIKALNTKVKNLEYLVANPNT